MAWTLFYLNKYGININESIASEVIASRDCVALLLLYQSGISAHQAEVINFVAALDTSCLYDLDQYWLLLYQLYHAGKIAAPYANEDAFELMKANGVTFLINESEEWSFNKVDFHE